MASNLPEAARLIQEALSGPDQVTEIKTESGQPIRVEREPEPGIQLRLTLSATDSKPADWLILLVDPAEDRPESYPSTLPFVRGVVATVAIFGESVSVTWRPSEGIACPVPEVEPDEELVEFLEQLKSARETSQERDAASRREAGQRMKAILDSIDPATRGKLEELWRQLSPDAELTGHLEQVFEDVLQASLADGWHLVEKKETDAPARGMSAQLERDVDSRSIMMMALSRSVFMVQAPRAPEPAA